MYSTAHDVERFFRMTLNGGTIAKKAWIIDQLSPGGKREIVGIPLQLQLPQDCYCRLVRPYESPASARDERLSLTSQTGYLARDKLLSLWRCAVPHFGLFCLYLPCGELRTHGTRNKVKGQSAKLKSISARKDP